MGMYTKECRPHPVVRKDFSDDIVDVAKGNEEKREGSQVREDHMVEPRNKRRAAVAGMTGVGGCRSFKTRKVLKERLNC